MLEGNYTDSKDKEHKLTDINLNANTVSSKT